MEMILKLLNNSSVILTIATFMIIAFAKCITKIFRMGVTFKADLATRQEQREFEEEVRRDMRGYAMQIQKSVGDSLKAVIDTKLKDIEEAKQAAQDIRIIKAEIDLQIKTLNERYGEMKEVADTLRALSNRVQRLEYSQGQVQTTTNRRSEN